MLHVIAIGPLSHLPMAGSGWLLVIAAILFIASRFCK